VRTAKINLGYANVTAPISGRIGRALVTEGALVGQGDVTKLALVQQIDPVYVNFTQTASEVLKLRREMQAGHVKRIDGADAASVRIVLEDGSEYKLPGRLLFTDLSVDASTSQVTLRAEVPNPSGELLPGLYVRVRIEQARAANATSVPQQAVTRTQQGDTLMVVGADGKVSQRNVKINGAQDDRWIVLEGLKPGEQVMVDGFQTLQSLPPGSPVKAVPWKAPAKVSSVATVSRPTPATQQ
jgi:membrane fusion protein (multidrug efflux system)